MDIRDKFLNQGIMKHVVLQNQCKHISPSKRSRFYLAETDKSFKEKPQNNDTNQRERKWDVLTEGVAIAGSGVSIHDKTSTNNQEHKISKISA